MRTRTAVALAGVLALLVVLPVAVIVGLGIAGGAQGGSVSAVSATGQGLRLIPAGGPPGSEITVFGRGWNPRQRVQLSLELAAEQPDPQADLAIGLGEIVTSRSGEFEAVVALPAMAIRPEQERAFIGAGYADGGGRVVAGFLIEPPANQLDVAVTAVEGTGAGADVLVSDAFGRELARGRADSDGVASFTGLPPGPVEVRAMALDHRPLSATAQLGLEGLVTVRMRLGEPDPSRLVIPDPDNPRRFVLSSIEIDRRSGLVADRQLVSDPDDRRRRPVAFVYQIPRAGFEQPALAAINVASRQISNYFYFNSGFVLYLGTDGSREYVFAHDNAFRRRRVLFVYDPAANQLVHEIELDSRDLSPLLDPGGSHVYVLNWWSRTLQVFDTADEMSVRTIEGLPEYISATTLDPATGTLWMSSALNDSLTPLDLASGAIGDPVQFASDLITLTFDPSRNRIYGVNYKYPSVAMIDLDSGRVRFADIQSPAMWIWPDAEGQLLFAATDFGKGLQVLDKDTLETVQSHHFVPDRDPVAGDG
ncbi:MAG: hypothetical protein OXH91_03295 [Chloroflexota bacterium]|nr:hypothetical protein [Chloroflexota bacterium]